MINLVTLEPTNTNMKTKIHNDVAQSITSAKELLTTSPVHDVFWLYNSGMKYRWEIKNNCKNLNEFDLIFSYTGCGQLLKISFDSINEYD